VILGVGIDHVEIERIRALLERKPGRAAERLFTERERERCASRTRPAECYAARFAAKEAFVKALGTGLTEGISWKDMEVRVTPNGRPALALSARALDVFQGMGGEHVHVSFSHDGGSATAVVIIEGEHR
jgi:holo-[acyl-carrier protein] synthase